MLDDIAVLVSNKENMRKLCWVMKARSDEGSRHLEELFITDKQIFATDGFRVHIWDISQLTDKPFDGLSGAYEVIGMIKSRKRVYLSKTGYNLTHVMAGVEELKNRTTGIKPQKKVFVIEMGVNADYLSDACKMSDTVRITIDNSLMYTVRANNIEDNDLLAFVMGMKLEGVRLVTLVDEEKHEQKTSV
jgi:hypothetical protein